jgi:hypothetical protein
MLVQLLQAPVLEDAGVQEVLVDGGKLGFENLVQKLDDFLVALHGRDLLLYRIAGIMAQNYAMTSLAETAKMQWECD